DLVRFGPDRDRVLGRGDRVADVRGVALLPRAVQPEDDIPDLVRWLHQSLQRTTKTGCGPPQPLSPNWRGPSNETEPDGATSDRTRSETRISPPVAAAPIR